MLAYVVTHTYTDGHQVCSCPEHDHLVPDYSPAGASYSGVLHGAHEGLCSYCEEDVVR